MKWFSLAVVALVPAFLVSCVEESTVIKVSKDGSGIVHQREYSATKTSEEDVTLPDEAELRATAERMGAKFQSCEVAKNPKGWFGHEVIFVFDDINQLGVRPPGAKAEEDKDAEGPSVRFKMADGVLEVVLDDPTWREVEEETARTPDGPTIDPYADTTGPRPAKMDITSSAFDLDSDAWKKMSKGMRLGIFLQIDGALAETNATYRKGSLFTLMNADFEKMTESGKLESLNQLKVVSRDQMKELVEEVDGFDMELQAPARFVFE